jgi:hypothetical protein
MAAATIRRGAAWWQWPTILSIDAPAVSLVWLAWLGCSLHIALHWPPYVVLGSCGRRGWSHDPSPRFSTACWPRPFTSVRMSGGHKTEADILIVSVSSAVAT